ncbi:MAG: hypothetical protein HC905_30565 [Bacteroidales bacterium]|nr:hypothetical protein [Bacteroidales bacterium]
MKKIEIRKDIQADVRIQNLIIHYELGNDELLEYLARNTKRYLESRENYFEFEKIIFGYFNRILKKSDDNEKHSLFEMLKTACQTKRSKFQRNLEENGDGKKESRESP